MKKAGSVLLGIVLIAAGVIWALNEFNVTNINVFFDGWWTLFIIVPCAIGLFTEREKTGNIIRGDKTTRWVQKYKMKFVRSLGVETKTETGKMTGHNCPNCGAPLEISSSGVCEYCGSVVTTGQYSWVLTDFSGIRNDTVDDGIKGV